MDIKGKKKNLGSQVSKVVRGFNKRVMGSKFIQKKGNLKN